MKRLKTPYIVGCLRAVVVFAFFFMSLDGWSAIIAQQDTTPLVHMEVERLPDMNISRACHSLISIGDEILAVGGHTDGFLPTATAEYLADGEWHQIPTTYIHD